MTHPDLDGSPNPDHTDLHQFGGFEHGVWLVVRAPMSVGGYDELDPDSYHALVHAVGGSVHNPVRGIAFLLGHSTDWGDRIRWLPDPAGDPWQRLQWMLDDEGDDPENPKGGNGRNDLQHVDTAEHSGENIRVAGFFDCGRGGYMHPQADAMGVDAVRAGLGKITESVEISPPSSPTDPDAGPPVGAPTPSEAGLIFPCCCGGADCMASPFGPRNGRLHAGIDWDCGDGGEPMGAAHDGTVSFAGGNPAVGYGNYVDIVGTGQTAGLGTRYAHMQFPLGVVVGQEVLQGDFIGRMGNSGSSSGPHVHFEVRTPISGSVPFGEDAAVDPMLYLPANCEDIPISELPPGVPGPSGSITTFAIEGLDGTIINFIGTEWAEGPDDQPHSMSGGTWSRLAQMVAMIHRRTSMVGVSPTLLSLDGENIGTQWEHGTDYPVWNAVNGNHYLSPRAFWAPRIKATGGEAAINSAWHYATDKFSNGAQYGRCELLVDVEGANQTHIGNIISWAGAGISKTGLRGGSGYEDTVTSGIVFLDDAQKVLDQGLAGGISGRDWDDMFFWNYGDKWDGQLLKWVITTPIVDMDILTESGEAVTVENEVGLMPQMIVGDFFGRMLIERADWKTGDRPPTMMWVDDIDFSGGAPIPAHMHEAGGPLDGVASLDFGIFFFEVVNRSTFAIQRSAFAEGTIIGVWSGVGMSTAEWAFFGSPGLQGFHAWYLHLERGTGEGRQDTEPFIFYITDPRLMREDKLTVPQSPTGTLGDMKIVGLELMGERRADAQPAARLIHPRFLAGSAIGFNPDYNVREFEMPFATQPQVSPVAPAPGAFIPGPPDVPPGGPVPPPGNAVFLEGNTTVINGHTVNNSILNHLYGALTPFEGSPLSPNGDYELAAYIAVMLTESGGDPMSVGICLAGLGHAIGLFQLLTGADPECPGTGGMGHAYSKEELFPVATNVNIARNGLLDSWRGAVEQAGDPPDATTLSLAFASNGWAVGAASEGMPFVDMWLAIRDGIEDLPFPLPE